MTFDMRIKLIVLFLVNLIAMLATNQKIELLLIILISLYHLLTREYKRVFKGLGIYLFIQVLIFTSIKFPGLMAINMILIMAAKKIYPIIYYAQNILNDYFGKLLYALDFFKLPKQILIMIAVVFRTIPALSLEIKNNKDAFRLRKIKYKISDFLNYSLVPLMKRAELVSDELSQVAVLRGMESQRKRTSIFESSLKLHDMVFLLTFISLLIYTMVSL